MTLTAAFLQYIAVATSHRRKHERMIVVGDRLLSVGGMALVVDTLPGVLLDVDMCLGHMPVLVEEVSHQT